jgi:K+-sensing histidine kinase KdpD
METYRKLKPYILSTIVVAVAFLLKLLIPGENFDEIPFLLFFSAVVIAALYHDLRMPLIAARMSAEIVRRHPERTDTAREAGNRIDANVDQADHMIRDLLDAKLIAAGQTLPTLRRPADLREIVAETLANLEVIHGHRFGFEAPLRPIYCEVDGILISRLLENLCTNAVEYGASDREIGVDRSAGADHQCAVTMESTAGPH